MVELHSFDAPQATAVVQPSARFSSRQLAVMVRTCQLVVMTSKTCLPHSSTPWLHCRTWASIVAAPQASMYHHPPPGGLELYSALRCKYNGRLSVSRQAQLVQA